MITYDEAHEWLKYDPETGILTWRKSRARNVKAGYEAGNLDKLGYKILTFSERRYKVHRVIWLMVHGKWPEIVDHINRKRADNRISNLRDISASQNSQNADRRRGKYMRGVSAHGNNFRAKISINGKPFGLGVFDNELAAHEAYVAAKEIYHPYFNKELTNEN